MADSDKLVVLGALFLLLGISYLAAVRAFASDHAVVLSVGYLVVALVLLLRVARAEPAD